MESRAKFLGHPVHQMLVTFPIGAFGFSVTSDVLHTCFDDRKYSEAAKLALDFGILTAALAVPFGTVDWAGIRGKTRAKRVGLLHALGNTAVLGLFGASRWLRSDGQAPPAAKWLSGAGFALAGVTAWLGGELVDRHGVGVRDRLNGEWPEDERSLDEAPASMPFSDEAPTLPGVRARPLAGHA